MPRRFAFVLLPSLLLAALWLAESGGGTGVRAQTAAGGEKNTGDRLNRSLHGAALQLAASSLFDGSGGITAPTRLPMRVAVLPLHLERNLSGASSRLPLGEAALRARFVDMLLSVRHGDAFVIAPLSSKDMARIARMTPGGIKKGEKPENKVLDAARKAGADCVLYGTLTPISGSSRDPVWLANWVLLGVGSDKKSVGVKANVLTTLNFNGE